MGKNGKRGTRAEGRACLSAVPSASPAGLPRAVLTLSAVIARCGIVSSPICIVTVDS